MKGCALLLCVITAAFALAAGCAPIEQGRTTPPDPYGLVNEGKALLAQGDAARAGERFQEALALDPALDEARFGLVLAKAADLVVLVDDFVDLITKQMAAGAQGSGGMTTLSDSGIGYTIDHYVRLIFLPTVQVMLDQSEALYSKPDATFTIDALPISWSGQTVLDLGGRWDHSDAVLLLAVANLLQGAFDSVLARDLDFNLGYVFALPIDWNDLKNVQLQAIWRDLVHMVIQILADPNYPNFLGLTQEGQARMPAAGSEFGLTAKYVTEAGWLVRQETGDQSGDVIGYVDANANGVWDPGEPLRLPSVGVLTDAQMKALADAALALYGVQDSFLDGSAVDPWPDVATPLDIAVFNPLFMDLTGWDFGPIPSATVDLGGLFARPNADPTAAKQAVVQFLTCIDQNQTPADMLRCWIALYGGTGG